MKGNKAIAFADQRVYQMESRYTRQPLHATLPLRDLISVFEGELRKSVGYDSFEYEHDKTTTHIFYGTPKLHKCQYRIHTAGVELGQVTLTRKQPFAVRELAVIEKALGALTIHLSNAIEYESNLDEEQLNDLKVDAYLAGE